MILVTLTCAPKFYLSDRHQRRGLEPTWDHMTTVFLANELPKLIINDATELGIGLDVLETDVEVDIKGFHLDSKTTPDLRVQLQLTDPYPDEDDALSIRDRFSEIVMKHLRERNFVGTRRVVVTWTPGHSSVLHEEKVSEEIS